MKKYFTTTATITAVLTLMALSAYIIIGAIKKKEEIITQSQLNIYIKNNTTKKQLDKLKKFLLADSAINNFIFVSKADAVKIFEQELKVDISKLLNTNPLPASFIVTLKPDAQVKEIEQQINKQQGVESISYPYKKMEELSTKLNQIVVFATIFFVIMGIVVLIVIRNSVRMDIASSSEQIRQAIQHRLPKRKIKRPFIIRAYTQGVWAGVFAAICLVVIIQTIPKAYPNLEIPKVEIESIALIISMIIIVSTFLMLIFVKSAISLQIKESAK